MSDVHISTPQLSGSIIGSGAFGEAWRQAPKVVLRGAKDGIARGLLGFRKEWLSKTGIKGLQKPRNKWIWIVRTGHRGTIDTVYGRMFPRKFHRSFLRFERGGTHAPREARFHAIAFRWNRTKAGRPRKGYQSPDTFARTFPNRKLVPIPGKGGSTILMEFRKTRGRWRKFKPAFLLVPRIRTPHRLKLRATWDSPAARTSFIRRLNENVDKALAKAFGRTG